MKFPSDHESTRIHVFFSARVFWREDSKHSMGFSFSTSCRQYSHKMFLCVFCGPFCKTVRFSLLVISAAIQKERKGRGSVLSGLVVYDVPRKGGCVILKENTITHRNCYVVPPFSNGSRLLSGPFFSLILKKAYLRYQKI